MEENPCSHRAEGGWGGESFEAAELGMDGSFGDVTLYRCRQCRRLWLHYHYENEALTGSGLWYHGLIPPEMEGPVKLETACEILDNLYWSGGSHFGSRRFRRHGKIDLFP
jgi:hypothetical protein